MNKTTHRFTPVSVGGDDVYALVPDVVRAWGHRVALIGGATALSKVLPVLEPIMAEAQIVVEGTLLYGNEASHEGAAELAARSEVQQADVLIAVGGGKAIDTVKLVHGLTGIPYITIPTIASTCAATTEVAAVYTPEHVFKEAYYCGTNAAHTFLNMRILAEAPPRFLWAGMGDTLAKYYESRISARGRDIDYFTASGCLYSGMCKDPIVQFGVQAYADAQKGLHTRALEEAVLSVIVGTGQAAVLLPEDYNSHVAHAVCYGLTMFPEIEEHALHGEMVAYGVLVLLVLDKQFDELETLLPLYEALGLPRTLAHFGIRLADTEKLLTKAVSTRDTAVSPYPITKEALFAAMEVLEQRFA